jgi:hypothetical protein
MWRVWSQNQQGLIRVAIVELRRSAQYLGDDGVSGLRFFQD